MTDDVHALSGLYALDVLSGAERLAFDRHLRRCATCATEVAEFQATVARLGAAEATAPPASLKAAVMNAVATTRQESVVVGAGRFERRRGRIVLGAVAAVLALVVGILSVRLASTNNELDRMADVSRVLTAPDAASKSFAGSEGISARVVGSSNLGRTVVALDGLPPVAPDKAYALWLIDKSGPKPVGLVRPDAGQRALAVVPEDASRFDAFGLTVEPRTGSQAPTTPLLVQGALP